MTELFSVLRRIIMRVTGVPECVYANGNGIMPTGEYATLLIAQSGSPQSMGYIKQKVSQDGRDVTTTNVYPVSWEVTVNFWRGKAFERASKLLRMQNLPLVTDELNAAGIGLVDCSQVINLTALQSQSFEQRAVVTLTVTTTEEVSETVGVILFCKVGVQDESGNTLEEFDIKN